MIPSAEAIVVFLQALAIPLIVLLFFLDGMVLGKLTPPAALYVAYVALSSPSAAMLVTIAVLSTLAATTGQYALYRGFNAESSDMFGLRQTLPYLDRLPLIVRARVGERRMGFVSRLFDRFGGWALGVTNAIPGIRSLMSIPAGLSNYPRRQFLLFSSVGNAGYLLLLTAVAKGLVDVAGAIPW